MLLDSPGDTGGPLRYRGDNSPSDLVSQLWDFSVVCLSSPPIPHTSFKYLAGEITLSNMRKYLTTYTLCQGQVTHATVANLVVYQASVVPFLT
jgi:hypothetical protein